MSRAASQEKRPLCCDLLAQELALGRGSRGCDSPGCRPVTVPPGGWLHAVLAFGQTEFTTRMYKESAVALKMAQGLGAQEAREAGMVCRRADGCFD